MQNTPAVDAPIVQSVRNRLIGDDRSGDELRKHGDIHREIEQAFLAFDLAPIHVGNIGDPLKGIKRNADRQRNADKRNTKLAQEEIGIFEGAEIQQMERDAQNEQKPFAAGVFFDADARSPIHQNAADEQDKMIGGVDRPDEIESKAADQQHKIFQPFRHKKIAAEKQRHEKQNKRQTAEDHRHPPFRCVT